MFVVKMYKYYLGIMPNAYDIVLISKFSRLRNPTDLTWSTSCVYLNKTIQFRFDYLVNEKEL